METKVTITIRVTPDELPCDHCNGAPHPRQTDYVVVTTRATSTHITRYCFVCVPTYVLRALTP